MRRRRYSTPFEEPMQSGLSPLALLILTRAWFVCDSGGNLPLDPFWLRSQVMPLADVRPKDVTAAVEELRRAEVWLSYESGGRSYAHIVGFVEDGPATVTWPEFSRESAKDSRAAANGSRTSANVSPEFRGNPRKSGETTATDGDGALASGGNGSGPASATGVGLARAKVSGEGTPEKRKVSGRSLTGEGDSGVTETSGDRTRERRGGGRAEIAALVTALQGPLRAFAPRLNVELCCRALEKHLAAKCGRFLHYEEMEPTALRSTLARWLEVKRGYIVGAAEGTREIYVGKFFPDWLDEHAAHLKGGTLWQKLKPPKNKVPGGSFTPKTRS